VTAFPAAGSASVPPRPDRFTVGLVGAGRAGSAMAAALARVGHELVGATTASHVSPLLPPDLPRLPADEIASRCQLLLLTVPDDTLPDLVRGLAVTGALRTGQLVVHAAGRYGLDVLAPAVEAGAFPLALHPAMTFTGQDTDLARLADSCIAVTAPDELRIVGEALALELGGEPVHVPEPLRATWHAALTHGANHLVTLIGQAADLLAAARVRQPDRVLGPLLHAALENTLRDGDAALTGPVSRGDVATVRAHLEVLAASPARAAYVALAGATADRAGAAGRLDPESVLAVHAALGER